VQERQALDISDLLVPFNEWLAPGRVTTQGPPQGLDAGDGLYFGDPVQLGWGPPLWSSSTALALRNQVCHDVNGYYREMGVHWRCSGRELTQAYCDQLGPDSARLTYIFKQLRDPLIREAYDSSPLGVPFMDDYTERWIKRRAATEASARMSRTGRFTSAEEVLQDWGLYTFDDAPGSEDNAPTSENGPLDTAGETVEDQPKKEAAAPWGYASYAWKTSTFLRDEERLGAWQAALGRAARIRSFHSPLAIGSTGVSVPPFTLVEVRGEWVILFSEAEEPSDHVAGLALDQLLQIPPKTP
jgi:hypothetical protein